MGFEESMIEDGFHDEETYLEHLMDEADREWERQQNDESSWDDNHSEEEYYEEDYDEGYVDDEWYEEVRKRYQQWIKENPIMQKLFMAWIDCYSEWEDYEYFILDKFLEWESMEEDWRIGQLKDYYGEDFYQKIYSFFKWQVENPIEEELRPHSIEYFDYSETPPIPLPDSEVIYSEVWDFEEWIRQKENYEKWLSEASDEEKNVFFKEVDEYEFDGDNSVEHVRDCVLRQLNEDDFSDYTRQKIKNWYDRDPEKARDLVYYIRCVENHEE